MHAPPYRAYTYLHASEKGKVNCALSPCKELLPGWCTSNNEFEELGLCQGEDIADGEAKRKKGGCEKWDLILL